MKKINWLQSIALKSRSHFNHAEMCRALDDICERCMVLLEFTGRKLISPDENKLLDIQKLEKMYMCCHNDVDRYNFLMAAILGISNITSALSIRSFINSYKLVNDKIDINGFNEFEKYRIMADPIKSITYLLAVNTNIDYFGVYDNHDYEIKRHYHDFGATMKFFAGIKGTLYYHYNCDNFIFKNNRKISRNRVIRNFKKFISTYNEYDPYSAPKYIDDSDAIVSSKESRQQQVFDRLCYIINGLVGAMDIINNFTFPENDKDMARTTDIDSYTFKIQSLSSSLLKVNDELLSVMVSLKK